MIKVRLTILETRVDYYDDASSTGVKNSSVLLDADFHRLCVVELHLKAICCLAVP